MNKSNSKEKTLKIFLKRILLILEWLFLIFLIVFVIEIYFPNFFGMPRSAPAFRSRDVARKNDLYQIQKAIIVFYEKNGEWPQLSQAVDGMGVWWIKSELFDAWMSEVPKDPGNFVVSWLWEKTITWDYMYMVSTKDWILNWWFILMAKLEVGNANRIVCGNGEWNIGTWTDLSEIKLCNEVLEWKTCSNSSGICTYKTTDELRYILIH